MFIAECQFKYGGIAKAPGEHPGEQNSVYINVVYLRLSRSIPHVSLACCIIDVSTGPRSDTCPRRFLEVRASGSFTECQGGDGSVGQKVYSGP